MTERSLRTTRQGQQCRICLQTNQPETLVSPCSCRGSIQYVHQNCIKEYFVHRFKTVSKNQRKKMKSGLKCQICKQNIQGLRIDSKRRCMSYSQIKEELECEDVFFLTIFAVLYVIFHAAGVIIILQDKVHAIVIGAVWLAASAIAFNYGLYKIIRKLFTTRQATVVQYDPIQEF